MKELSHFERSKIISLKEAGKTWGEIIKNLSDYNKRILSKREC